MEIGIICAVERELAPFLACIKNETVSEKSMLKIHEGSINSVTVAVLYCGVCKVNAAAAAQILIDNYGVTAIINAGTAGGMCEKVQLLDAVISTEVAYHDVEPEILTEYHPWMPDEFFKADDALLCAARSAAEKFRDSHSIHFGRMVTGEAFITDSGRAEINDKYHPLSVDMETAAISHVCYINKIPFIAVRTITDTATHSGQDNFEKNIVTAAEISKDITLSVINELQKPKE